MLQTILNMLCCFIKSCKCHTDWQSWSAALEACSCCNAPPEQPAALREALLPCSGGEIPACACDFSLYLSNLMK